MLGSIQKGKTGNEGNPSTTSDDEDGSPDFETVIGIDEGYEGVFELIVFGDLRAYFSTASSSSRELILNRTLE